MRKLRCAYKVLLVFALLLTLATPRAFAVPGVETPTSTDPSSNMAEMEQLLEEAQSLFTAQRPIDARSKLQKALQLAPKDYRPHLFLGAYYLSEVAHFRLADQYLRTAEKLFEKQFGNDEEETLNPVAWRQHARLLYLLSEARLNLDDYKGSLEYLDRFGKRYWDDWYPGTKAWVLMKLKRVDEAVQVAQAGLIRGAEPGRTYNILGILLSLKGSRELSIEAFGRAIKAEFLQGGSGQVATPLNNAGEVYRELFADEMAEAAWLKAVSLPDGCDHILPSLNLAILYIDQLRLLEAERALSDFEACFAQHSIRSDTEHRALLALARGRIALRSGETDRALEFLNSAIERQQWFGKIGTNQNDLQFAAAISMASALRAKSETIRDTSYENILSKIKAYAELPWLAWRAWWLDRRAREIAVDELDGFEDLYIRNTDAMIEYPTITDALAGFPLRSIQARLTRISSKDDRKHAHTHYDLYRAAALLKHGDSENAERILRGVRSKLRTIDRLAQAEATALLLTAKRKNSGMFSAEDAEDIELRNDLFALLPSHVRNHGFALAIELRYDHEDKLLKDIAQELTRTRFAVPAKALRSSVKYVVNLTTAEAEKGKRRVNVELREKNSGKMLARVEELLNSADSGYEAVVNNFIAKVFRHTVDPPSEPTPALDILKGIF